MGDNQNGSRPFGIRDKLGYMFGDFGNDFTFIFASSFLMVFYTKVLGVGGGAVGTLFLTARFVDAFTDVSMGRLVDSVKPAKDGRFRCWLRRMCGPVALASFLMYQSSLAGASMGVKLVYMYATYLLWGSVFYTSINIPYGSMASAITADPNERTSLSAFRNIGATLAGLVIGVAAPLLIYTTDGEGNQMIRSGSAFTAIAGLFSVLAVICYLICYRLTTERVRMERDPEKASLTFGKTMSALFRSRALIGIIGAAIFLLLSQLLISSMNNYLYPEYFKNAAGISVFTMITTFSILLVVAPLSVGISSRYGKKESAAVGMLLSGAIFLLLYFLHIRSMWLYLALSAIAYLGLGYFNTVIWASITDVIDDQELRTGQREDGTVYAVYSFARKAGQALAGGIGGWALSLIGYESAARVQTEGVIQGIYTTSTLAPAVGFLITAFFLWVVYPLDKEKVAEHVRELKEKRKG